MPLDPRTHRVLRQHVETERLLGVAAVPARGEAPDIPLQVAVAPAAPRHASRPEPRAAPAAVEPASSPAVPRIAMPDVSGLDRDGKLNILSEMNEREVRICTKCGLHKTRTQTVFGEGDADAQLMFVGEGPGQNEDEQGRPFVGRAGKQLDLQIAAMGLRREQVYIANVVKCRPPNNRAPNPIESDACSAYLHRQIAIIQPRVIVTLGGPAMKLLLPEVKLGITKLRGTWHEYHSPAGGAPIAVMPTFHPAYLLRAYTRDNRMKVWSDLQAVMKKLGLPTPVKRADSASSP